MPKPARLPQLAGKPPQSWFYKLTTTVPWWWSKCRLQIYCFNFFCLTKALQILKRINVTFVPVFSKDLMTEILCNFWKEPPCTIQLRLGTICETNVRCLVAVCYFLAGFTPQSRFFGCTIPGWCFQNLHFMNNNVLFAFKRLDFDFIGFINLLEWPILVSLDVSFRGSLNIELWCWTWNCGGDFWVSVFIFSQLHSYRHEQSSNRHVTLNY